MPQLVKPCRAAAGIPARLQGELAVSRAFGDLHYRRYGLIADPELHWHNVTAADRWLVLVSDGILESLADGKVCQIAANTQSVELMLPVTVRLPEKEPSASKCWRLSPASTLI